MRAEKEQLSFVAEFSADPEQILPEPEPQEVEAAVEATKQREQAEKARKRPRRSFGREER